MSSKPLEWMSANWDFLPDEAPLAHLIRRLARKKPTAKLAFDIEPSPTFEKISPGKLQLIVERLFFAEEANDFERLLKALSENENERDEKTWLNLMNHLREAFEESEVGAAGDLDKKTIGAAALDRKYDAETGVRLYEKLSTLRALLHHHIQRALQHSEKTMPEEKDNILLLQKVLKEMSVHIFRTQAENELANLTRFLKANKHNIFSPELATSFFADKGKNDHGTVRSSYRRALLCIAERIKDSGPFSWSDENITITSDMAIQILYHMFTLYAQKEESHVFYQDMDEVFVRGNETNELLFVTDVAGLVSSLKDQHLFLDFYKENTENPIDIADLSQLLTEMEGALISKTPSLFQEEYRILPIHQRTQRIVEHFTASVDEMTICLKQKDGGKTERVSLKRIPFLWHKVREVFQMTARNECLPMEGLENVGQVAKDRHMAHTLYWLKRVSHVDPLFERDVCGITLSAEIVRELVLSLHRDPPTTNADWRTELIDTLPSGFLLNEVQAYLLPSLPAETEEEREKRYYRTLLRSQDIPE